MRKDKNKALKMRLSGKSYNEIKLSLKIPKSTLSEWFSNTKLPPDAKERLAARVYQKSLEALIKRNKNQTLIARESAKQILTQSSQEINRIDEYALKLIGACLYWAEGYKKPIVHNGKVKTHHPVALTNSDPAMIKMFLRFLTKTCNVSREKIRVDIRLYKHMNQEEVLNFWQRITGLPRRNFGKTYLGVSKSSLGARPFNRLPYGTIMVRVNNTKLFYKIMGWIHALSSKF